MASAEATYVDPSALRRLYVHDTRSKAFCAWRSKLGGSLPLTLHGRAELLNSVALALFRGDINENVFEGAVMDIERDLTDRRLFLVDLLWRKTLNQSADLSQTHTPRLGTRTLDVLHVASAKSLRCRTFVTYDERQASLAKTVGLRVLQP